MSLIDIATRRRVTIAMFTVTVLLFGAVSLSRLEINLLPDLSYPTLTVRTEYPGAAPAEIENLITKPIEETVGVVKNVRRVSSISRSGQSDVVLEFFWGTDMNEARVDLREKMDALTLPLDVEQPILLRFDPTLDPVMRFGLYYASPATTPEVAIAPVRMDGGRNTVAEERLKYLRRFAEQQLKKELESALGVAAVKISGGLEDEIQVLVDPARLAQLQIPIETVTEILRQENVNRSGGRLEEGIQQFLVRTLNQFGSVEEIGDVIVANRDGTTIYMRDIADIRHGYKEREAITRMNGTEAVEVAIYKEGDANPVAVSRAVTERLERIRTMLPEGTTLDKVYDQSTFIVSAVDEVVNAALIGGILAVIVLYVFLRNVWTTVIISLSIPVSVVATFNLMFGADLSLNIMSLGGIALGIGLLVDNSIVVLENIARHREKGATAVEAARRGAGEVGMAVVASTLTTVAVFLPLVFVKGVAGQLFRDQALTVTFALLASLLVALTLIPMLSSLGGTKSDLSPRPELPEPRTGVGRGLRRVRMFIFYTIPTLITRLVLGIARIAGRIGRLLFTPLVAGFTRLFGAMERRYPDWIDAGLRHRPTVILVALLLFAGSLALVPRLGLELIPQLAQGEYAVEFRMPPGTPLEQTDAAIARIQNTAAQEPTIQTVFSVAGTGNRFDANPEEGGENWGEMNVTVKPGAPEERSMDRLRNDLARIPGLQYKFSRPTLFTFKTPVEVEIYGYDLADLKRISGLVAERMTASGQFADVKSTMEVGHPELQIFIDRERAAALGIPVYDIAQRVVTQVRGDVATRYSWDDRKIDVLVRAREEDRAGIDDIRRLIINPGGERPVPLSAVARVVIDEGPGEIRRIGQERVALVTANLARGDLGSAATELQAILAGIPMPGGLSATLGGQNEEMQVSFQSLQFALLLAIFLVYLVMASQFESLVHPFVILFTIPLALIGAVGALWVTGSTISVVVLIGLILLAGIVVNNAIVLIDLINQLRARGLEKREAIREGGRLRLRPIMMTTLTTTLGLLPLALGFGEGAEMRAPMGITVIGGLLVSTLLTLIVIPVVYDLLDRKSNEQIARERGAAQ